MALQGVDISKTPSAGDVVFQALRRAIIEGELEDGDPIRQDDIARQFNTSRIPVREAIARLEQQGLVKSHRFKGAVVAGLSIIEAGEIFDFRCLIEAQVIRCAVPRMTRALITEVQTICDACEAATELDPLGRSEPAVPRHVVSGLRLALSSGDAGQCHGPARPLSTGPVITDRWSRPSQFRTSRHRRGLRPRRRRCR